MSVKQIIPATSCNLTGFVRVEPELFDVVKFEIFSELLL